MSYPIVSVVMSVYNHEKFVGRAIQSVLDQTMGAFELIVVDNASTDGTSQIVGSFCDKDSRVKQFRMTENCGMSGAMNAGMSLANEKYLAFVCSDDTWKPTKLEKQLDEIKDNIACFTHCELIDEEDLPTARSWISEDWFNIKTPTQVEAVQRFFSSGNFLCFSSALLNKERIIPAPKLSPYLPSLQDFGLWTTLIKLGSFHIVQEKLTGFRIQNADGNLSHPTRVTQKEKNHEYRLIYENFFSEMPMQLYDEAFCDSLSKKLTASRLGCFY